MGGSSSGERGDANSKDRSSNLHNGLKGFVFCVGVCVCVCACLGCLFVLSEVFSIKNRILEIAPIIDSVRPASMGS